MSFSRPSRDFSMVAVGCGRTSCSPGSGRQEDDGTGYREVLRYGPQDDRFRDTGFENWSWDDQLWLFRGHHRILVVWWATEKSASWFPAVRI